MRRNAGGLDAIDRKLLALLVEDAEQSYAALGEQVGLSAPQPMNGSSATRPAAALLA